MILNIPKAREIDRNFKIKSSRDTQLHTHQIALKGICEKIQSDFIDLNNMGHYTYKIISRNPKRLWKDGSFKWFLIGWVVRSQ